MCMYICNDMMLWCDMCVCVCVCGWVRRYAEEGVKLDEMKRLQSSQPHHQLQNDPSHIALISPSQGPSIQTPIPPPLTISDPSPSSGESGSGVTTRKRKRSTRESSRLSLRDRSPIGGSINRAGEDEGSENEDEATACETEWPAATLAEECQALCACPKVITRITLTTRITRITLSINL